MVVPGNASAGGYSGSCTGEASLHITCPGCAKGSAAASSRMGKLGAILQFQAPALCKAMLMAMLPQMESFEGRSMSCMCSLENRGNSKLKQFLDV